jgi:hypothetical protein
VTAIQLKLERNDKHGPLTFQEWVYLLQTMESLYNDWNKVTERIRHLLDKLCRAHGLDWRELYSNYDLKKPYELIAAEQYSTSEDEDEEKPEEPGAGGTITVQ